MLNPIKVSSSGPATPPAPDLGRKEGQAPLAPPREQRAVAPTGEGAPEDVDALLGEVREVLSSIDVSDIDPDALLVKLSAASREDQEGSFLMAQETIAFNRRMRDRIYQEIQRLNEEMAELEEEIHELEQEIEDHGFFEKIGEGIASAFGGGKNRELQELNGDLAIMKGQLDETKAQLEERQKLLAHGHELMREAVDDLKHTVERIHKSIDQLRGVWDAAARTLEAT